MFRTWVEIFLGKIGNYIITFIADYYYFIVPPIIIYGIFLTLSSYNFKRIEKSVNREIIEKARAAILKEHKISYTDLVGRIAIDWDRILKKRSFFPYISQESDLWVLRASRENVRDIIMQDHEKIRLVLERNGIFLLGRKPDVRKNLYRESIYRVTRKK